MIWTHNTLTVLQDVVGFYFLDLATSYQPADDLAAFLAAGEPPIYIGFVVIFCDCLEFCELTLFLLTSFGSVVVADAAAMTRTVISFGHLDME
jgi:sterol 3beta-glucosyltransferase